MLGNIHYDAWMTLFLKRRKVLDYELFEQQAINNNKTYECISFMQEIKLQDCESKSFSFPQKNNAFGLYRYCPWIAHTKTVSQISSCNGTLFKIIV